MENREGKIIAVWGNPGCGKTTVSAQLALAMAKQKKNVLLVHTDITCPMLPVVMPSKKEMPTMGGLWNNPNCNSEQILASCVITDSKYICLLGYKAGENVFSYPDYAKEDICHVFMELKELADYVIVDCVSYLAHNFLTVVALEIADSVIRIEEATLSSYSFFDSSLAMIRDARYCVEKHIRVLGKQKVFQPKELGTSIQGTSIELPYEEELEVQMLEGRLLAKQTGGKYKEGMETLLDRIERNGEDA